MDTKKIYPYIAFVLKLPSRKDKVLTFLRRASCSCEPGTADSSHRHAQKAARVDRPDRMHPCKETLMKRLSCSWACF